MGLVDPEGLQRRGNVGKKKRRRDATGTFTSGRSYQKTSSDDLRCILQLEKSPSTLLLKFPLTLENCFKYNKVYYTVYNGNPATIEEFVEGEFRKYINNTGKVCTTEDCTDEEEVLIKIKD